MRVGLVLDNPRRDLNGLVLLAYQLLKAGHDVFIVPMYEQGYDVPLLKLDFLVVNYARLVNKEHLSAYKDLGIKVAVLDTEGGVILNDGPLSAQGWANMLKATELNTLIDFYFTWGPRVRDAFVAAGTFPADRVFSTGAPRYDFCGTKWRPFLGSNDAQFILVNTNFSSINPKFSKGEDAELNAFLSAGYTHEYATRFIAESKSVFAKYLDTIERLAKNHPQEKIWVRPHPFEDENFYINRYSQYANVQVSGAGDVLQRIPNAKMVLHLNCGSAVETNMLGRVPVQLEFLNTPVMYNNAFLAKDISYCVSSEAELDRVVSNPAMLNDYKSESIYDSMISPWFGPRENQAAKRVADIITENAVANQSHISLSWSIKGSRAGSSPLRRAQGLGVNSVGSNLFSKIRGSISKARNSKRTAPSQVLDILKKISRLDGGPSTYSVKWHRHPVTGMALNTVRLSK